MILRRLLFAAFVFLANVGAQPPLTFQKNTTTVPALFRPTAVLVKQGGAWTTRPVLATDEGVEGAVDRYMALVGVERVEPDVFLERFGEEVNWGLDFVRAPEAWTLETGDSDTRVCVVDSGVDADHPDLVDKIAETTVFCEGCEGPEDYSGHGTHIAGVIGGMNKNVSILSCRFMLGGGGYLSDALLCLEWCLERGAIASSHSYGADFFSEAYYEKVRDARGHTVVAAAGNHGSDLVFYPAGYDLPNVISVAALDPPDGRLAGYSGRGWTVDVAAPGSGIFSAYLDGGHAHMTGTSMATPHVAGAVALVVSAARGRVAIDPRKIILETAVPGFDGIPFLDVYAAVAAVAIPPPSTTYVINSAFSESDAKRTVGDARLVEVDTETQCRRECLEASCVAWTYSIPNRTCDIVSIQTSPGKRLVRIGAVSGAVTYPPPPRPPPPPPRSPPPPRQSPPPPFPVIGVPSGGAARRTFW